MQTNDTPPEITFSGSMPLSVWLSLHHDYRFHVAASRPAENTREPELGKKGFPLRGPRKPFRRKTGFVQTRYYESVDSPGIRPD